MKWHWFSFSYEGINQGCCIVEANSQEKALQKTIDLNIHPRHDDIECYIADEDVKERDLELKPDRLYSREEMQNLQCKNLKGVRDGSN